MLRCGGGAFKHCVTVCNFLRIACKIRNVVTYVEYVVKITACLLLLKTFQFATSDISLGTCEFMDMWRSGFNISFKI